MIRLYHPELEYKGQILTLPPQQSHYLQHVMRNKVGHKVHLFNEKAGEWQGILKELTRQYVTVEIQEQIYLAPKLEDICALIIPLIKPTRFEWVMEKSVELGVTHIFPVITERTGIRNLKSDRIQAILIESAEQCERLTVPKLYPVQSLVQCLDEWTLTPAILCAVERHQEQPFLSIDPLFKNISFLVGPEGGWADPELDFLKQQTLIKPISLGKRILRTETAALMMLALYQIQHSSHSPCL